jgi:cob(I)alamin adenosyltransferase
VTKIYTKTGDDGTTGLPGGVRASKDSPRIIAYGSLDELNSLLGVVCSCQLPESVQKIIIHIQDDLFTIGAMLASDIGIPNSEQRVGAITDADVKTLENEIDTCEMHLPPLKQFILPGGSPAGAFLHLARTVSRRAERHCVALARIENVPPSILHYMNRLSDLLFVLARLMNNQDSQLEMHPTFRKS